MPRPFALCLALALALACTRGPSEAEVGPEVDAVLAGPRVTPTGAAPSLAGARALAPDAIVEEAAAPDTIVEEPVAREAPRRDAGAKGRVRVSVLAQGELLRSEQRALAGLKTALGRRTSLEFADATDDERAFARAHLDAAAASAALPAAWSDFEAVIVLEVLAPRGVKPERFSRGLGGVLIVRPPRATPVFLERVEGEVGIPLGDDGLPTSLRDALALTEEPA